jgi:hypothetical protein
MLLKILVSISPQLLSRCKAAIIRAHIALNNWLDVHGWDCENEVEQMGGELRRRGAEAGRNRKNQRESAV